MGIDSSGLLWWLRPGQLAGMAMPALAQERRACGCSALDEFNDDLPLLYEAGIRSVVCLLNIPGDMEVYRAAGFEFLCIPVPDGYGIEDPQDLDRLFEFWRSCPKAMAIHCQAGLGRTGFAMAAILISEGLSVEEAVRTVRAAEPSAIETHWQMAALRRI